MMWRIIFSLLWILPNLLFAQQDLTMSFDGDIRDYKVYTPINFNPTEQLPLVFVLHGFTQSSDAIMAASEMNDIADTARFVAVYPEGINLAWNIATPFPGGSTADDVGFISALIDTMIANYNIDPCHVYSTGLSAGAYMSYRLACEIPERITAIAPVAGTMTSTVFSACNPSVPTPILHIHGTSDGIVPYGGSFANESVDNTLNKWRNINGCIGNGIQSTLPDLVNEGSTVDQIIYNPCDDGTEIRLLKVNNGGHNWPGATVISGTGTVNMDIKASVEAWNFFKRFDCSTSTATIDAFEEISIYPNPASNKLVISNTASIEDISILDLSGKELIRRKSNTVHGTYDLTIANLDAGIYILQLRDHSGRTFYSRIIKQ